MNISIARGSHYQSPRIYQFLTVLKLRQDYQLRYRLASEYIRPGEAVLDVCAGSGEFREFLPVSCSYQAIEASPSFIKELARKRVNYHRINLHEGTELKITFSVDTVTMIISLYQFQDTTIDHLLENFKKIGKKVVIVEEVAAPGKISYQLAEKIRNYLCSVNYYRPARLFSAEEFCAVMHRHGYSCGKYDERYWIGYYGSNQIDGSKGVRCR